MSCHVASSQPRSSSACVCPQPLPKAFRVLHAGVRGLWAVRFRPEGLPWEPDFAFHAFLLITVGRGTKVLQTGQELTEMQGAQVDFVLNKPTLLAANLLSWARTVQVTYGRSWIWTSLINCWKAFDACSYAALMQLSTKQTSCGRPLI